MKPKVSVIIPVYNAAPYLSRCLDSVLTQTLRDIEVICVDDGSTDGGQIILEEYEKRDSRLHVICRTHNGVVAARKVGLRAASGDFVGFMDSDDWAEPELFLDLYERIRETDADFIDSGLIYDFPNRTTIKLPMQAFRMDLAGENVFSLLPFMPEFDADGERAIIWGSLCSKLFKKDLVTRCYENIPDALQWNEDVSCTSQALFEAKSISSMDSAWYHYCVRPDTNGSRKGFERLVEECGHYLFVKELLQRKEAPQVCFDFLEQYIRRSLQKTFTHIGRRVTLSCPHIDAVRGHTVILYGAGKVGRLYCGQLLQSKIRLIAWVDKHSENCEGPFKVTGPEDVGAWDADFVVIAVLKQEVADEIRQELLFRGVPDEKILWAPPAEKKTIELVGL